MKKKIFALGFFDGVHLGHQALLAECCRMAQAMDCIAAAITFDRHPKSLFAHAPMLLNSIEDRKLLLRQFGIEQVFVLPVTREHMAQPWQDFLEKLLLEGAAGFVCGDDFRFGHKGEGNSQHLEEFCRERTLPCSIVPEQSLDGIRISSTHIRNLIRDGEPENAMKFLGHPHILGGTVVHGRHLGRTIGIPTANVQIPEDVAVPKPGVYASICWVEGTTYPAVTNIGSRPTVGGHQLRAESWLLDYQGDLYGAYLTVQVHHYLRPELKFDSLEQLQAQIRADAAAARSKLAEK